MGSGQRAYRMAQGASLAEKESYLAELEAGAEDVSDISAKQNEKINTLIDSIKGQPQPQVITAVQQTTEGTSSKTWLVVAIFIIVLLWQR